VGANSDTDSDFNPNPLADTFADRNTDQSTDRHVNLLTDGNADPVTVTLGDRDAGPKRLTYAHIYPFILTNLDALADGDRALADQYANAHPHLDTAAVLYGSAGTE
jgi:hypothetical protein